VVVEAPVPRRSPDEANANAALSFRQRERMVRRVVDEGWSVREAADAPEVSARTAGKWVARYRAEGAGGLLDRSSAPMLVANRSDEQTVQAIAALRRLRFTGPEIAEVLDRPPSTVSGILTRIGMGRLGRLGLEPAERYERTVAGELIHIDVKKLGRIHGGSGKRITGHKRNPGRSRCHADHRPTARQSASYARCSEAGLKEPERAEDVRIVVELRRRSSVLMVRR
jgi:transposase